MKRKLVIEPVTRIEGHARITIALDDSGGVADALFQVTQFRGFEKFCEGRPFHEMPSITARICGICPVSHLLASAKAGDELMAVRIPPPAAKLRRLLNLAQLVQSHALSFFYLSAPDLLLGMDAEPASRNIVGLMDNHAEIMRDGIRLRQFGQQAIEWLAGKRIHPAWVVPGGVASPLEPEVRERILDAIPQMMSVAQRTLDILAGLLERHSEEADHFGRFPSLFMGLVGPDGALEHYDGRIRVVDCERRAVVPDFEPSRYEQYIAENVEPWTYLKFPYFRPMGPRQGLYRVGPLARLNLCERCGTPRAEDALRSFRALEAGAVLSSFHYHFARLVEVIYALEQMECLLYEPDILERHVRAEAAPNALEGVGVIEAPRGTLIHHYRTDEQGLMRYANLIVATGHNNLAINAAVRQVASRFIKADQLQEGMLNRVEAVVRAFDPCLSCSTHAVGQMPIVVQLVGPDGSLLDELRRD